MSGAKRLGFYLSLVSWPNTSALNSDEEELELACHQKHMTVPWTRRVFQAIHINYQPGVEQLKLRGVDFTASTSGFKVKC